MTTESALRPKSRRFFDRGWARGATFTSGASLSVPKCGHYLDTFFFTAGKPLTAA